MKNFLISVRLRTVLLAVALYFVGLRLANIDFNYQQIVIALFILIAGSATMAQNDWNDRYHDARKGKNYVLENATNFKRFLILLWVVTLILVLVIGYFNINFGFISTVLIILGYSYSLVRKIPLLPAIFVGVTSAGPLVYPILENPTQNVWLLLAATATFISGREVLKDLNDVEIDDGYKWTLPVKIGKKRARIIAGVVYLIATLMILPISSWFYYIAPALIVAALMLFIIDGHKAAKIIGDLGMGITLILFLLIRI